MIEAFARTVCFWYFTTFVISFPAWGLFDKANEDIYTKLENTINVCIANECTSNVDQWVWHISDELKHQIAKPDYSTKFVSFLRFVFLCIQISLNPLLENKIYLKVAIFFSLFYKASGLYWTEENCKTFSILTKIRPQA